MTVSPDGKSLYVTAADIGSFLTFSRDPDTGLVTQTGCLLDSPVKGSACGRADHLSQAGAIAVSADGRDVYVGAGGRMVGMLENVPGVGDRLLAATMFDLQRRADAPTPADRPDALYRPLPGRERGDYDGHVMESSVYTTATLHPVATMLGLAALGAGIALASRAGLFEARAD